MTVPIAGVHEREWWRVSDRDAPVFTRRRAVQQLLLFHTRPHDDAFPGTLGPRGLGRLDSGRQTATGALAHEGDVLDLAGAART